MNSDRPPFKVWGDSLAGVIRPLRFAGGLSSRRLETGLGDELLASFSDRSAAVVVSPCGAGSVAVLNIDLARSNVVSSPLLVTLLSELCEQLLSDRRRAGPFFSGEPATLFLPAGAGDPKTLSIEGPLADSGTPVAGAPDAAAGKLLDEGDGLQWIMAAAGPPGAYRVTRGGLPLAALATEIPPEESDLAPLPPDVLAGRLAGDRPVHYRSVQGRRSRSTTCGASWPPGS